MGISFRIIAVQSGKANMFRTLKKQLEAAGYVTDNLTPDFTLTSMDCGGWIALRADDLDFPLTPGKISQAISRPVLEISCFDSDELTFSVHHGGKTGKVCIGCGEKVSVDADLWSAYVSDTDRFAEICSAGYVFAEEALMPLGELMGFDGETMLGDGLSLGFSHKGKKSPLAKSGPVRFIYIRHTEPDNFGLGIPHGLAVINTGDPGKGVFVIAEGEIMERDDVFIRSPSLMSPLQRKSLDLRHHESEFKPAIYDGRPVYRADFPDFEIPRGISTEYQHVSLRKQMMFDHEYSVIFNFTVEADAPVENLVLRIVPIENPAGEWVYRQSERDFSSADTEKLLRGEISFQDLIKRKRTFE